MDLIRNIAIVYRFIFQFYAIKFYNIFSLITAIALAPPPQPETPARLIGVQNQPKDVAGAATLGRTSQYAERPPDFGEYVDFGAHTGDNGAFGWYADFPINNHEDSSYRK